LKTPEQHEKDLAADAQANMTERFEIEIEDSPSN